jgi:hypothetical protein
MKPLLCAALAVLAAACNTVPDLAVSGRYGPVDIDGELGVSSG